jgi:hypothetical protein
VQTEKEEADLRDRIEQIVVEHARYGYRRVDCAPPAGEISSRFEGSVIGAFSLLNCHLEFLRG